jgi:hypothetical protein
MEKQLDLTAPLHEVEILIREDGSVLWVNVDGINRLRICQIPQGVLKIEDHRKRTK